MMAAMLAMMIGTTGFAALVAAVTNESPPNPHNTEYLLGFSGGLALLVTIWRRYWFLPSDLRSFVNARDVQLGATALPPDDRARMDTDGKRLISARIGDVRLVAVLDHPVRGYWPGRMVRFRPDGAQFIYGLNPEYMLRAAVVELVREGDFSRLPRTELQTSAGSLQKGDVRTGDIALDLALREAAAPVREIEMPIAVRIASDHVRVGTSGGSWLGARFGFRIGALLGFLERLAAGLEGRFTST